MNFRTNIRFLICIEYTYQPTTQIFLYVRKLVVKLVPYLVQIVQSYKRY